MSSPRRRKIVQQLREEGAAAFHAGKPIQTCPHRDMDRFQWEQGWVDAKREADEQAESL